ncbi:MAG: ABC transporter ATP-binding protein [SAR324 cluster bacterium]|nr:ABC transporter ATP-binding protein [SAR324 cluster bacterium]
MQDEEISPTQAAIVLELQNVSKVFPGVIANDHVNFTLRQGEIHTILGENGAGKSTLMNVIAGLYPPDGGDIFIDKKKVRFTNPRQAILHGIGMVHQHFMLVRNHTVTENIILGTPQPPVLDLKRVNQVIQELGDKYGLTVSPDKKIQELSVGEQQRVEILKVLYRGAKILILDEPTAVLTPQESEALYKIIENMVAEEHSIIFISHKMKEVISLSDRITVLSRGKVLATLDKEKTNAKELAKIMMGDEAVRAMPVSASSHSKAMEVVVRMEKICADDDRGHQALKDIDLEIRSGQIVGLAGVSGNGQAQLAEVLSGIRAITAGNYYYCGESLQHPTVNDMIIRGLGYIPEDRKKFGIAGHLSIANNFLLRDHKNPDFYNQQFLSAHKVNEYGRVKMEEFDIRAASEKMQVGLLSGGNIQKTILARESSRPLKFLLASQPIRGLDVNATAFIQQTILKAKSEGLAVLLITEDLDELFLMSDHIYVICRGEIVGHMPKKEASTERIGLMMTGMKT